MVSGNLRVNLLVTNNITGSQTARPTTRKQTRSTQKAREAKEAKEAEKSKSKKAGGIRKRSAADFKARLRDQGESIQSLLKGASVAASVLRVSRDTSYTIMDSVFKDLEKQQEKLQEYCDAMKELVELLENVDTKTEGDDKVREEEK